MSNFVADMCRKVVEFDDKIKELEAKIVFNDKSLVDAEDYVDRCNYYIGHNNNYGYIQARAWWINELDYAEIPLKMYKDHKDALNKQLSDALCGLVNAEKDIDNYFSKIALYYSGL